MTDWCLSKITFIGPEDRISDLVTKFDGKANWKGMILYQLFGGYFLPRPDYVSEESINLSREWAWDHWGCKYGNHGATLKHRAEGTASFLLKTDWNPPIEGLCWLTSIPQYREVNVRVEYEMQGDFCGPFEITKPNGYCVFSQGKLIMEADSFVDQAKPIELPPRE